MTIPYQSKILPLKTDFAEFKRELKQKSDTDYSIFNPKLNDWKKDGPESLFQVDFEGTDFKLRRMKIAWGGGQIKSNMINTIVFGKFDKTDNTLRLQFTANFWGWFFYCLGILSLVMFAFMDKTKTSYILLIAGLFQLIAVLTTFWTEKKKLLEHLK
jgi:hypothetical protein